MKIDVFQANNESI